MAKGVGAGGDGKNSSITFLVSGNAEWPPLRSAWLWARRLVEGRGPGAEAHALTSVHSLWHTLVMRNRALASASLDADTMKSTFGGLRGHTVIWLFPGNFLAPEEDEKKSKLDTIIPFVGQGRTGLGDEQALTPGMLDKLSTTDDGRVTAGGGAADNAWAWAMTPLYAGFFRQLVLVPAGADANIESIANKIHDKIGIDVYWNTKKLIFPDSPAPEVRDGDKAADGQAFVGGATVALQAKADAFLPGTMARAVGKAAKKK